MVLVAVVKLLVRLEWSEQQEVPFTQAQVEQGRKTQLSESYQRSIEKARLSYRAQAILRLGQFKAKRRRHT